MDTRAAVPERLLRPRHSERIVPRMMKRKIVDDSRDLLAIAAAYIAGYIIFFALAENWLMVFGEAYATDENGNERILSAPEIFWRGLTIHAWSSFVWFSAALFAVGIYACSRRGLLSLGRHGYISLCIFGGIMGIIAYEFGNYLFWGWQDYSIVPALVIVLATCVIFYLMTKSREKNRAVERGNEPSTRKMAGLWPLAAMLSVCLLYLMTFYLIRWTKPGFLIHGSSVSDFYVDGFTTLRRMTAKRPYFEQSSGTVVGRFRGWTPNRSDWEQHHVDCYVNFSIPSQGDRIIPFSALSELKSVLGEEDLGRSFKLTWSDTLESDQNFHDSWMPIIVELRREDEMSGAERKDK
jgi:hypothetical protein